MSDTVAGLLFTARQLDGTVAKGHSSATPLWGRRGARGARCAPRQNAELVWLGDLKIRGQTAAAFAWSGCAAGTRGYAKPPVRRGGAVKWGFGNPACPGMLASGWTARTHRLRAWLLRTTSRQRGRWSDRRRMCCR
jgi:hypothetical protein